MKILGLLLIAFLMTAACGTVPVAPGPGDAPQSPGDAAGDAGSGK